MDPEYDEARRLAHHLTQHIDNCLFREADDELQTFLAKLRQVSRETACTAQLIVTNAWLQCGEIRRARRVFDTISYFAPSSLLKTVEHELRDCEEAEALGCSVYPSHVPMCERWVGPRVAPTIVDGLELRHWFPGMITSADEDSVHIVIGNRSAEGEYRSAAAFYLPGEWAERANGPARVGTFLERGHYSYSTAEIPFLVRIFLVSS